MQTITSSQASPEVPINENFLTARPMEQFGVRQPATTGLTWGFYGGQFNGNAIADGTVTLTASTTNYVVALRSTGVVSTSTATTNWNNTANYLRLYTVVTGAASITSNTDFRQAYGEVPESEKGYTVATLPAGAVGMRAYVTDATAPTYLGTLTGGGAVRCPVFHNGTAWVSA
jgi:hypothetical protein